MQQLLDFTKTEKNDYKKSNMIIEISLKGCLMLNNHFIKNDEFYILDKIWVCFDKYDVKMKEKIIYGKPETMIFLNSCFNNDNDLTNLNLELKENKLFLKFI